MYLGNPENVPLKTGIKKARTVNIKYEVLTFFFQAIKSKIQPMKKIITSSNAIHHSYCKTGRDVKIFVYL